MEGYRDAVEALRAEVDVDPSSGDAYLDAVSELGTGELQLSDLATQASRLRVPIVPTDDFLTNLVLRRRRDQLGAVPERYLGGGKVADVRFASIMGLSTPTVHYRGTLRDVPEHLRCDTVVKPIDATASRGVYYLFAHDDLHSVQHSHAVESWDALLAEVSSDLGPQAPDQPRWMVQDLVRQVDRQPAHALQFFTFYGHVDRVLEVIRFPEPGHASFDGTTLDPLNVRAREPGRISDRSRTLTSTGRLTDEQLALVEHLSLELPAPFMRIDFLHDGDDLHFLGMSSLPPGSDSYSASYNRRTGKKYLQAENRLMDDLLAGKQFDAHAEFLRQREAGADRSPNAVQRASIDRLARRRDLAMAAYRTAVEQLRVEVTGEDDAALYLEASSRLGITELTHDDLTTTARQLRRPVPHGDSFWTQIVTRRRKKQVSRVPERRIGVGKVFDTILADVLGLRMPRELHRGSLSDVPAGLRNAVVVKPLDASDSVGAFYVFAEDDIHAIWLERQLSSWDALLQVVREHLGDDAVDAPRWVVQELILESDRQPARDIKFYSMYGEFPAILEVSRFPRREVAYFDGDTMQRAEVGRQQDPFLQDASRSIIDRGGLTEGMLELGRRASLALPIPFIRLDFLWTPDELVFLEASTGPGNSHSFNRRWDRRLGKAYLQAETRLVNDLLSGKSFSEYEAFISRLDALPQKP